MQCRLRKSRRIMSVSEILTSSVRASVRICSIIKSVCVNFGSADLQSRIRRISYIGAVLNDLLDSYVFHLDSKPSRGLKRVYTPYPINRPQRICSRVISPNLRACRSSGTASLYIKGKAGIFKRKPSYSVFTVILNVLYSIKPVRMRCVIGIIIIYGCSGVCFNSR